MDRDEINFENLFNAINDFLFILDLEGNIIEVNNAVDLFLEYTREELKNQNILCVYPKEYKEKALAIVENVIRGEKGSCLYPLLAKNGDYIPVETIIYPSKWNNRKVLIGISRNLSEISISEKKFRQTFDNSQTMMAISDIKQGIFIDVNKAFLNILGYSVEEVIGHSSKELNLFHDYKKRIELAEKTEKLQHIENEYIIINNKTGKDIHCLLSMSIINIQTYSYLLTSAMDISKLKVAEQQIKRSLYQQTLLADISQSFLDTENLNNKIQYTLQLMGKHTGVSRVYIFEDDSSGLITSNTYEWCNTGISPQMDDLQEIPYEVIPSWKKILNKEHKVFSTNIQELPNDILEILEPQGIKSILVLPLFVQNRFWGFIGFDECVREKAWDTEEVELLRTISGIISYSFERQLYQQQLHESELRLKLAIENTEAGLWDWNIKTGEVFFNDIWCNMLGYKTSEIETNVSAWEKLVHPFDMPYVMQDLNDHLEGNANFYENIHRLKTKSGQWKWIKDKGRVIEFDEDGKPARAIGTHIDIDEQKKIESELRDLNVSKDKFFSIIAHDLRGPIGSMMQISEMISEQQGLDSKTFSHFIVSQKELSKSTFQLLENLLNWARYNRDKITPKPQEIDLKTIIEETLMTIKYKASQKNISILTSIDHTATAYADKDMTTLIIRNLISNALKFTNHNGVISINTKDKEKVIEVIISDTGIGISEENIEKILSKNQYYSSYGTDNEKGTGLGLKLCKTFTEQNHGQFLIKSQLGKGSDFSFTLPIST